MTTEQTTTEPTADTDAGGRVQALIMLQSWEDDYEPDAYDEWEQGCIDYDQQQEY